MHIAATVRPGLERQSTQARPHLAYLDGLRALAALFVVLCHSSLQVDFSQTHLSHLVSAALAIFGFGHYAVDLFIVLSGFCLMLPVLRSGGRLPGGAIAFLKRRARRILPPYYWAMAFSLVLIAVALGRKTGTMWDNSIPVTVPGVTAHALLLQDAFRWSSFQLDYPLWSISVEWRIYLAFPLLLVLWSRLGPVRATLAAVACGYGLLLLLSHTPLDTRECGVSPQYIGLFALGMFGADMAFSDSPRMARRRASPGLFLALFTLIPVVIALSVVPVRHGRLVPSPVTDLFVGTLTMLLLVLTATRVGGVLHRVLSWKPFAFLGTFAYSIYLIHAPLLQVLWQTLFRHLHTRPLSLFVAYCAVGVPIVVALSYLFHLLFEKPFMGGGRTPQVRLAAPPIPENHAVVSLPR